MARYRQVRSDTDTTEDPKVRNHHILVKANWLSHCSRLCGLSIHPPISLVRWEYDVCDGRIL